MPRSSPGEEIYTERVQPEDLPRKVVPYAQPVDVAGSIGRDVEAVDQKYRADSATWAGDQLAQFRQQAVQSLTAAQQNAPAGDPGDFTPKFLAGFDKAAQALSSNRGVTDNPYASAMITRGVGQLRDTLNDAAMQWEATQRLSYQRDSFNQNLQSQLGAVRAHPELADQVGGSLSDQVNSTIANPAEKLSMMRVADQQLTRSAALGLVDRNPGDVYLQLTRGGNVDPILARVTDPNTVQELKDKAAQGVVNNLAAGVVSQYAQGPAQGQKAFGAINELTIDPDPTRNAELQGKVREQVDSLRRQMIEQNQQTHSQDVIRLEESLKSGQPDEARRGEIWAGYKNGWLSPEQAGAYLGEDDRINSKGAQDQAGMQLIAQAWAGGAHLDPKDKDQKEDADLFFRTVTKDMPAGSPGYVNTAAEFARRTGIVPESVGSWARSILVSGADPNSVMSAADTMERMREAAPRSFDYLDDDHRLAAMADSIAQKTRAGMAPAQAVQVARADWQAGETDRKLADSRWAAARPFGRGNEALENAIHTNTAADTGLTVPRSFAGIPLGRTQPAVPPAMQADYELLTRSYFDHNGFDINSAQASAARDIGTTWGVSMVNGDPELMKYAPERMFRAPDGGPGLTAEDVRTDIATTVARHPESFQHWDPDSRSLKPFDVDPDRVKLLPMPGVTDITRGVGWGLAYQDEHGNREIISDAKGAPLRFDLPVTRMDYQSMRTEAMKDLVASQKKAYREREAAEAQAREGLERDIAGRSGVLDQSVAPSAGNP